MAAGRAGAGRRPRRRADQGAAHRHLRHRPAHPGLGRLGAAGDRARRWSSATSSSARSSRSAPDVADIKVGDLVSGEGHLVCGKCRNCLAGRRHLCRATVGLGVSRDGAFAEYVALPAANVWVHRVPVDLDVAAIFDPFGNAVHTALSFPLVGEDVLITGAGPIGIMAAAVARHAGARNVVITDVSEPRLELARKVGVDLALNVAETTIADGAARARHARGLRRRPGDVRPARRRCAT